IGPNGAGKTTLFRMIAGQDTPDRGTLRVGDSVKLAYVDQSRDALDGKKTVWEEISGGQDVLDVGGRKLQSRAYVASFNFKGSDQQKRVSELSGGERNRLHLAKMLKSGGNVLLLDEPSNDLDVDTLRALEDGLLDFAGCAIVISHDRWFLDRIATHMLAFEDEGRVVWFEGNYQDYEADRRRRLGDDVGLAGEVFHAGHALEAEPVVGGLQDDGIALDDGDAARAAPRAEHVERRAPAQAHEQRGRARRDRRRVDRVPPVLAGHAVPLAAERVHRQRVARHDQTALGRVLD